MIEVRKISGKVSWSPDLLSFKNCGKEQLEKEFLNYIHSFDSAFNMQHINLAQFQSDLSYIRMEYFKRLAPVVLVDKPSEIIISKSTVLIIYSKEKVDMGLPHYISILKYAEKEEQGTRKTVSISDEGWSGKLEKVIFNANEMKQIFDENGIAVLEETSSGGFDMSVSDLCNNIEIYNKEIRQKNLLPSVDLYYHFILMDMPSQFEKYIDKIRPIEVQQELHQKLF